MKAVKLFVLGLALFTVAAATNAQSLDTTANSSAGSSSGAQSQLNLTQNTSGQVQYSGHFSQTQNSQVPISVVGYSSFSQASCITAIGGGATTRMFSFVYNGPKADTNCQHVVLGDAFGRATQLALQAKVPAMATASLSMVFYKYCTASEDDKRACISLGLVTPTGKVQRIHGEDVAEVLPAKVLPEGAEQMAGAFGMSIPSRPAGWTGVAQGVKPVNVATNAPIPTPESAVAGTYRASATN